MGSSQGRPPQLLPEIASGPQGTLHIFAPETDDCSPRQQVAFFPALTPGAVPAHLLTIILSDPISWRHCLPQSYVPLLWQNLQLECERQSTPLQTAPISTNGSIEISSLVGGEAT